MSDGTIKPRVLYTWKAKGVDHRMVVWRTEELLAQPWLAFVVECRGKDFLGDECWLKVSNETAILQSLNYLFYSLIEHCTHCDGALSVPPKRDPEC